eukprot:9118694-Pyramimonas_sp.AAC.1
MLIGVSRPSCVAGETIVKKPGSLNGYDFVIELLNDCDVFVLDHTSQVRTLHAHICESLARFASSTVKLLAYIYVSEGARVHVP